MKARKIALAIAAITLALPAAFATAPPALAGGLIPTVTVDTSGVPACQGGFPCTTLGGNHTGTFSGTFHPTNKMWNDTQGAFADGTCEDGNSHAPQTCEFKFLSGDPATLCTPNPNAPWSTNWDYRADASQANDYGGVALYAEGGGIVDFTGSNFNADGVAVTTRVHVEIAGLCGNEATVQGIADTVGSDSGFGNLDLSNDYKFTGYIDITPTS